MVHSTQRALCSRYTLLTVHSTSEQQGAEAVEHMVVELAKEAHALKSATWLEATVFFVAVLGEEGSGYGAAV